VGNQRNQCGKSTRSHEILMGPNGSKPVRTRSAKTGSRRTLNRTVGPVPQISRTLNWTLGPVRDGSGSNQSSEPNFDTTRYDCSDRISSLCRWEVHHVHFSSSPPHLPESLDKSKSSSSVLPLSFTFHPPSSPYALRHLSCQVI
jgi:hypothetical protein